jgi:hypothetical protein
MNDAQGSPPVLPQHRQRNPEPAVPSAQSGALSLPFIDGNLLAEGEILQRDRVMAFSEQPNQSKQTQQEGEHVARFFLLSC